MNSSTLTDACLKRWQKEAENLAWFTKWTQALRWHEPFAHWFLDGKLNASYLCADVHVAAGNGDKKALLWCNEEGLKTEWSYCDLYERINSFAITLEKLGVRKGDRVVVYLPMIPEAIAALLAIARLGATHVVVFSGFSSNALCDRIKDVKAEFLITADYAIRRGKYTLLKNDVDEALSKTDCVKKVLIIQRRNEPITLVKNRDVIYDGKQSGYRAPEPVESNHPLFVLYTSGTTGKPKGLIHSTGGYLTYCYATFKWAFNPQKNAIYWCTGDIGWITGHSYVLYAPLMHGITSFMFEGAPDWPDPGVWWRAIEEYKISIFYTAPTAIRMAIKAGPSWPLKYDLSSLKTLGTVGEPISPEVWNWYFKYIGRERCPIIDTWWQTETGGFMIAPRAHQNTDQLKPGSVSKPLPCIEAYVLDEQGVPALPGKKGYLVIKKPWPGMAIGIYNDPERMHATYWSKFPGYYYTGDYAIKDTEGYFWILGRADEVLNLSGHRVGTAEIESGALTHPLVCEAAAIGLPDEVRGERVILFVTLKTSATPSDELSCKIKEHVRNAIGPFVTPNAIYYVEHLPKTRSGKIMRRLLKNIITDQELQDTGTLDDGASIEEIRKHYQRLKKELHLKLTK